MVYAKDSLGFSFEDAAQLIHFPEWLVGYVDDNSLILTFREGQTFEKGIDDLL